MRAEAEIGNGRRCHQRADLRHIGDDARRELRCHLRHAAGLRRVIGAVDALLVDETEMHMRAIADA